MCVRGAQWIVFRERLNVAGIPSIAKHFGERAPVTSGHGKHAGKFGFNHHEPLIFNARNGSFATMLVSFCLRVPDAMDNAFTAAESANNSFLEPVWIREPENFFDDVPACPLSSLRTTANDQNKFASVVRRPFLPIKRPRTDAISKANQILKQNRGGVAFRVHFDCAHKVPGGADVSILAQRLRPLLSA